MAALVQSFPQQVTSPTMLQGRPSSSSNHYSSLESKRQRSPSAPLNMYASSSTGSYRGAKTTTGPVAPYAFTATPSLSGGNNPLRQHPTPASRDGDRKSPATTPSAMQSDASGSDYLRLGTLPDVDTSDLFADVGNFGGNDASLSTTSHDGAPAPPAKTGPNRYRQYQKKADNSAAAIGDASLDAQRSGSKDDTNVDAQRTPQSLKRYSRRSIATVTTEVARPPTEQRVQPAPPPPIRTYASVVSSPQVPERKEHRAAPTSAQRPTSGPRSSSEDSAKSSSRPSSKREANGGLGASPVPANPKFSQRGEGKRPEGKTVPIPPRGSSDVQRRLNPSPLSRPVTAGADASPRNTFASVVASGMVREGAPPSQAPDSPAAQQLAALNKKENKKEAKPSRLRRAFSFGSAAENNMHNNAAAERAKLHKDQFKDPEDAREAAIVQQQEASGLGASIYSGQGNFFTGSTDNLSISSTASSASLMLRKMGKGVKRTSRSLAGLFRPKSVVGVAPADGPVTEASVGQVSVVTVEAEREKVNVNLNPHDQAGGGTGFPKLGRNSIDAGATTRGERSISVSSRQNDAARSRPTINGGEKERAEVLAAVKKGILKRYGTDSASSSPVQRPADATLPSVPRISDSPHSSGPTTPTDDHRAHRRGDTVTVEGEDYFVTVARFAGTDKRSGVATPRSGTGRNISFSPRIQFHDTWPSQEYDRRGEIATCNRLTPSLAQAIKEELNTFKMEMEVHETSKVYTHFF